MSHLRICLVSAAFRPYLSGVSEHVHNLGVQFQKCGHRVHILTTHYPHTARKPDSIPVTRIGRALILPANHSRFTLPIGQNMPCSVKRFFGQHRFDLVHCHGLFPPEIAYWAARYATVPTVVTFHTLGVNLPAIVRKGFKIMFSGLQDRIAGRIAVSRAGRDWAKQWFPGEYHIIPNGVDLELFNPRAALPGVLEDNRPSVLFVGRIERRKGLSILLHAMPEIIASVPEVKLVVIGSGPLENKCQDIAISLGIRPRVYFAGRIPKDQLPGYYAGCTVFASPALGGEAMGIVLIEAMAAGKPVVASAIPGYDEVITSNQNGILVPPANPKALAKAIISLLTSDRLREKLSQQSRFSARKFAWPKIARQVESVYKEALN
ncbi:hypothetical protein CH330_03215 [candidate division WOR-3 bacterium JGI_Cruoil_03_51_56]|uniref:Glycosyltransferase family 1 protein n=1 Tax=candidate division WOR-3 bacterium JGI_Cruoil_03_51_56 TaxID=1973747 RepID=A0A235BVP9_UNCW3|nr:MAG: hypothetical protein CH330_03215 [candidate division WOR-3 bacterium JGI_Cruoil_03_51_56]